MVELHIARHAAAERSDEHCGPCSCDYLASTRSGPLSVATSLFDWLWGLWAVGGQEHVANIVLTFVIIYMF